MSPPFGRTFPLFRGRPASRFALRIPRDGSGSATDTARARLASRWKEVIARDSSSCDWNLRERELHRLGAAIGLFAKSAVDDHIVIYNRHRFTILADEVGFEVERYESFQFGCNQFVVLARAG